MQASVDARNVGGVCGTMSKRALLGAFLAWALLAFGVSGQVVVSEGAGDIGVGEGAAASPAVGTLKLGLVIGTTGRFSKMQDALNGYKMRIEQYNNGNASSGLQGFPVVDREGKEFRFKLDLKIIDDQGDRGTHLRGLLQLLRQDKVDFLLGGHPEFAESDGNWANRETRLNIHCCTESYEFYRKHDLLYVSGVPVGNHKYAEHALESLFSFRKIGIVYDVEKEEECNSAKRIAEEQLLNVVMFEMVRNSTTVGVDYDGIAKTAMEAEVDAFISCTFSEDGEGLLRAFDRIKYHLNMFFLMGPLDDGFLSRMGNLSHHVVTANQWYPYLRSGHGFDKVKEYREEYMEMFNGQTPSHYAAGATAVIDVLVNAFQLAFRDCSISDSGGNAQDLLYVKTSSSLGCVKFNQIGVSQLGKDRVKNAVNRLIISDGVFGPIEFDKYRRNNRREPVTMQVLCNRRVCKEDDTNQKFEVVSPTGARSARLVVPSPNRYRGDCEPGHVEIGTECIACAKGRFNDETSNGICEVCPRGSYSNATASTFCYQCPPGSTSPKGAVSIDSCTCLFGFFSADPFGTTCRKCPEGALCNGTSAPPEPLPGYWSDITAENFAHRIETFECETPDRCLGGVLSSCKRGYSGRFCDECDVGYFNLIDSCYKCFSNVGVVFSLLGLVIVWYLINAVFAQNVESLEIILNWAQLANVIGDLQLRWPYLLSHTFAFANILDFDVDILEPGCLLRNWSFLHDMIVQFMLPLIISMISFGLYYVGKRVYYMQNGRRNQIWAKMWWVGWLIRVPENDQQLEANWDRAIAQSISSVEVTYLTIVKYCFDAFRCDTVAGVSVLRSAPAIECGTTKHKWIVALGVAGLLVYGFGYLGFVVFKLVKFCFERSFSDPVHLRRFGFLYQHYEIEYYWTEVIVFVRRLFFVMILVNGENPGIQVAMMAALIIVSLMIHVYTAPYVDTHLDILFSLLLVALLVEAFSGLLFYNREISDHSKSILQALVIGAISLLWVTFAFIFIREIMTIYKIEELKTMQTKLLSSSQSLDSRGSTGSGTIYLETIDMIEKGSTNKANFRSARRKICSELYYTFDTKFVHRALSRRPELMRDWNDLSVMLKDYMSNQSETSYLSVEPVAQFWRMLVERFPELVDFLAVVDDSTRSQFREFVQVLYGDFFLKKDLESFPLYSVLNWRDRAPLAQWLAMAPDGDRNFFTGIMMNMFEAANGKESAHTLKLKVESKGKDYVRCPEITERTIPSLGWRRSPTFTEMEPGDPFAHSAMRKLRSASLASRAVRMLNQSMGSEDEDDESQADERSPSSSAEHEEEEVDKDAIEVESETQDVVPDPPALPLAIGLRTLLFGQRAKEKARRKKEESPDVKMSSSREFWVNRTKHHTLHDLESILEVSHGKNSKEEHSHGKYHKAASTPWTKSSMDYAQGPHMRAEGELPHSVSTPNFGPRPSSSASSSASSSSQEKENEDGIQEN